MNTPVTYKLVPKILKKKIMVKGRGMDLAMLDNN